VPIAYDPSRTSLYHPELCDTIFKGGQLYSPQQLAVEAARLAYYRAEESPSERTRLVEALARVEFNDLKLLVDFRSGAAAFAARRSRDGTALLSFRGTRPSTRSTAAECRRLVAESRDSDHVRAPLQQRSPC
jgi:hypothetical protein